MAGVTNIPASDHSVPRTDWWKLVLAGILAFLFGVAAILLPPQIMLSRILDVVFGEAKPLSGSLTAVAALLALVALVAIDGLLNLFGIGFMEKQRASWARGVAGIVVAVAAIFWPGITAFVAVELIGLWAVLIGKRSLLAVLKPRDLKGSRTFHVCGVNLVGEDVIGVGAGDGEVEAGQQLGQRFTFPAFQHG